MTNPRDDLMALAPCPFCGGEAKLVSSTSSTVQCQNDQCIIGSPAPFNDFTHRHDAIAAWNTRLAASRPAPVDRETVARIIKGHVSVTVSGGVYAPRDNDRDGVASAADAILSLLRPAEPAEAALGGWTYEIQHGPDGEAAYAWVYDEEHFLVCTAKIHHAKMIVARMNDAPPKSPDTSAAILAERERCAAIADEWANKMALNYGRETANTIAAAIRQLPTTERGERRR